MVLTYVSGLWVTTDMVCGLSFYFCVLVSAMEICPGMKTLLFFKITQR